MEGLFWGKSLGDFELQDKSKLQDPSSNLTPVVGVLCGLGKHRVLVQELNGHLKVAVCRGFVCC